MVRAASRPVNPEMSKNPVPNSDMAMRKYSSLDDFLIGLDRGIAAALGAPARAGRPYPAEGLPEFAGLAGEREHAAGLMRVNHAGEVAAQALYHAQGLVAGTSAVREAMGRAAEEETDHLAWCEQRLGELGAGTSLLNPLWYSGSFLIGAVAGLLGDRWNLGFVAETERQVVRHLESHLQKLPQSDARSRAVVSRMRDDENRHATQAVEAGAAMLPPLVQRLMTFCAGIMTRTAYRL